MSKHHHSHHIGIDTPLRTLPSFTHERVYMSSEEWHILSLILRAVPTAQIVTLTGYSVTTVLEMINRLIGLGLVMVDHQAYGDVEPQVARQSLGGRISNLGRAIQRRITECSI